MVRALSVVLTILLLNTACIWRCDYNEFYNCYGDDFIHYYSKNSNEVVDILTFHEDFYIHTTIINDSVISDTSNFRYHYDERDISLNNYHERYERISGLVFLDSRCTKRVHFSCRGISWGDVYYKRVKNDDE